MITSPFTAASPTDPATLPQAAGRRYLLLSGASDRVRIAILDDHPVITLGVAAYLRSQPDFEIVHAETTSEALAASLKRQPCDVAVVDFYLPRQPWDGMDFIRRLRRQHPHMAVITFSAGAAAETEYAAFRAGATGYLPKSASMPMLVEMIRAAHSRGNPCGFITYKNGALRVASPRHPDTRLTAAEIEVLRQIAQGLSVTQIAARLLRSKKTISTHKRRAMKKLGLADDLALALYLNEKFDNKAGP
ncbi:response regulator transcription factor [Bordetella petrii]|uniref:response regulator transcription factor n=1 Tax=Bordetella petrii TaxID=94624 RepID=UPI001A9766C7|nr:response regulator transcription factor [Bordetella petrii]MBO1111674.1 response regulator transcription factor [Bordetella petrii]